MGWGTGQQGFLVAFNTLDVSQVVTLNLYPEQGAAQTWTVTLNARTRQSWAVQTRIDGAFAATVRFAAGLGAAALAQWDRQMQRVSYVPPSWRCEVTP